MRNPYDLEKTLHRTFSRQCVRGEWYAVDLETVKAYIRGKDARLHAAKRQIHGKKGKSFIRKHLANMCKALFGFLARMFAYAILLLGVYTLWALYM